MSDAHREPLLAATPISVDHAKMPANCRGLYNAAMARGYFVRATYAIGFEEGHIEDGEEVQSVLLFMHRRSFQYAALWTTRRGGQTFGFDFAQKLVYPRYVADKIGYRELVNEIKES